MQNSQLNRIIKLIKRTGEKTVIMDNESDAVMMLMDLGVYEKMLDRSQGVEKLTEEELLEKINRDVAIWRASNNDKNEIDLEDEIVEKPQSVKPLTSSETFVEKNKSENQTAPQDNTITINKYPNINAEQEHSAADIIAEEEEEKFYLEPVE
ncbi:MAG TPA: hypothetical protein VLK22_00235 [Candidatus Udaeobacter sp.]|nr:hypothetical protein [Candidatus Udaeobacter sp.]